ncbi:hypothetical protein HK101_001611 [Irineochytrium annulatum]|nr:hypothetical protein HK101_001611 [Irineochytrium annulatum]
MILSALLSLAVISSATADVVPYSADANTLFAFVTTPRPTFTPAARRGVPRDSRSVSTTLTMYIAPTVSPVVESHHFADDDYHVLGGATAALVGISPTITPIMDRFDSTSDDEPTVTVTFTVGHDYTLAFETVLPALPAPTSETDAAPTTASANETSSELHARGPPIYPSYVGCYAGAIDENASPYPANQPLGNQALMDKAGVFTVAECQSACLAVELAYSAVQVSTNGEKYCWCADALPTSFLTFAAASESFAADCSKESKSPHNIQGGPDSFAVYQVKGTSNTVPRYTNYVHYRSAQGAGLSSCYGKGVATTFVSAPAPFWAARSSESAMTVGICTGACSLAGYKYAGLGNGHDCFCSNTDPASDLTNVAPQGYCATPCTGDANEKCGGTGYLNIYAGVTAPAPVVGGAFPTYAGCFGGAIDGNVLPLPSDQPLPNQVLLKTTVTVAACQSACLGANFAFSAVQTSTNGDKYCWCGDVLPKLPAANCAGPSTTNMVGSVDSYAVYQVAAVNVNKAPLNNFFHPYNGAHGVYCYKDRTVDSFTVADFPASLARSSESHMTFGICTAACSEAGFKFAGLENGKRCYCTNTMSAPIATTNANCNVPCSGDPHMNCGGDHYISVYWKGN